MKLSKTDLKKVGIGALIAAGGAALSYLADWLNVVDLSVYGENAVVIGAVASIIINALRKALMPSEQSSGPYQPN